jgi:hypothetical protein
VYIRFFGNSEASRERPRIIAAAAAIVYVVLWSDEEK